MYSVYALGDPRTNEIRYVGIAKDVYRRYAQHLSHPHPNEGKDKWMAEIKMAGIVPTLAILESDIEETVIYERERHWIQHYLALNAPLTNLTHTYTENAAKSLRVAELSEEIQKRITHIKNWDSLISNEVATILCKLYEKEELSPLEEDLEVTPSEVAAIWSITNEIPVEVRYVREVKRDERIRPSREWGAGSGRRSLYKVKEVRNIRITNNHGRPKGSKNRVKQAA